MSTQPGGAAGRGRSHAAPTLCGVAVCAMWLGAASAHAGTPRLTRITPPGGQRGTTVEAYLTGRYLDQPQEVLFYEPGIAVESVELLEGNVPIDRRRGNANDGARVRVRLKLADDCPLGPHGLRLRTANGVTDYQRFFVGPFPTVEEGEQQQTRNDKRESAKEVPVNTTVLGRMNDSTDVDLYRVEVKRGQRISAEIEAARLGVERGVPDLHLAFYDANGKQLASADDSALYVQDPVLSMLAPRDGTYLVEVRHSIYRAANETYRLHVGTFSRPTALYPAGGKAGSELSVQVLGDPRGPWKQTVKLPADRQGDFAFVVDDNGVPAPSPNCLRVSPYANALESEPNDSPEAVAASSTVSLPMAFNGIINRPGDVDCFRFRANKGEQFRFYALANALGSSVDPTIWIKPVAARSGGLVRATDSRPNQLGAPQTGGSNRDNLDPILEFTVPADGDYILGVENDRGEGGKDAIYRVEVEPQTNAIFTYIPPEPANRFMPQVRQTVAVPAGNRYTTQVALINTSRAYNGELELVADGLPAGVTLHAPTFTPSLTRVPVVFEAAADAKPQAAFVNLRVRAVGGDKASAFTSGYRQVIPMNQYGNNDFYLHTQVDKLVVAVTEPAPFRVQVEDPKSALVKNGELGLKFMVQRADGFDGPVTVQLEWRPNGISTMTPLTIPAGKTEGEYLLGAARNAPAGSYEVVLTAMSGGARLGYYETTDRTYVASQPLKLRVTDPHLEGRFVRTSIERGKTAQMVCRLNHLQPFTGKAKATLGRLPRGVQLVEPREISAGDKEVVFTLRATLDCLVGNYQGIVLDVTVVEGGQSIRQLSGFGILRIDAERGARASTK